MESLNLPIDLLWDGKSEPDSPSSELFSLSNTEESWCFEDDFAKNILLSTIDVDEEFPVDCEKTEDIIFEFEYDVKSEQWLDVKPNTVQQPMDTTSFIADAQCFSEVQVVKLQNSELANELEKLCNAADLTQLTPPQTPPQSQSYINEILDFITQQSDSNVTDTAVIEEIIKGSPASSYVDYSSDITNSPASTQGDNEIYVAQGSEIVDEILRCKAQDLPDCNDDDSMYSSYSSSGMSQSNDSEWSPSPSPHRSSKSSDSSKSSHSSSTLNGSVTKKRVRPYSRNVEDKKSRKKEQNKNAATRYRQKKKQEMEEVLEEERLLTVRHEELARSAAEVEREVKYLKKLIKEFFKGKY